MSDGKSGLSWLNLTANGNVRPCRVIVGVVGAGNALKGIEATGATLVPFGISREFKKYVPGSPADAGYIATSGDPLPLVQPGDIGNAYCGAAITDPRLPLVSDSTGRVISLPAATGSTNRARFWTIGFPRNTTLAADEKVEVLVTYPQCVEQFIS